MGESAVIRTRSPLSPTPIPPRYFNGPPPGVSPGTTWSCANTERCAGLLVDIFSEAYFRFYFATFATNCAFKCQIMNTCSQQGGQSVTRDTDVHSPTTPIRPADSTPATAAQLGPMDPPRTRSRSRSGFYHFGLMNGGGATNGNTGSNSGGNGAMVMMSASGGVNYSQQGNNPGGWATHHHGGRPYPENQQHPQGSYLGAGPPQRHSAHGAHRHPAAGKTLQQPAAMGCMEPFHPRTVCAPIHYEYGGGPQRCRPARLFVFLRRNSDAWVPPCTENHVSQVGPCS